MGYLEAVDPTIVEGEIPTIEPTDLDLPSIAIGTLMGEQTTSRTFRSVEPRSTRWTVSAQPPRGMDVSVSPRRFMLRPGQRQEVELTVAPGDAVLEEYAAGALVLTSDERRVRVPMEVRPDAVAAPTTVALTARAAAGSAPLIVRAGFIGALRVVGWGLARPETAADETITTTTRVPELEDDPGTTLYPVTVPVGAQLLAGRIANADDGREGTDLDL